MSEPVLKINYDASLPITGHREDIIEGIRSRQVLIVAGETGSGKTTQIPKMCLDAGRGHEGLIACTQPRRIAARSMAARVAEELGQAGDGPSDRLFEGLVGYKVRFRDRTSKNNRIWFMTDGILLSEMTHSPGLRHYDTIIIDEAHERSLNIDFLLGYLKRLLPRRHDLRVIITSATVDTEKFSRHFDDAPVIEVSGRVYPVDIVYRPLDTESSKAEPGDRDIYQGIGDALKHLNRIDPRGDVLVFLSGEREIREAGIFLERQSLRHTEILPLFSRLSAAEQHRVFHPGPQRRVILCTNIAETSLTVPRIRFVIDSGFARISRYAHRSRIQRLPIEPISQASAKQRAGRCGRLGPGTCVRLYSEDDFNGRPEFTEPEILRTSLANVILQMLCMGLGAVEEFPFVDPPAPRMINDAYNLLFELGAIGEDRSPTAIGKRLVRWPMDVRLGRMVLEADRMGCVEEVLVLASVLSIQDPRERPLEMQQKADESHDRFVDPGSDFAGFLRLWRHLRERHRALSGNQFRNLCRREFFNWQRVLEWFDLHHQLRVQAREEGIRLSGRSRLGKGVNESIHKALLSGLLSHVGQQIPESRAYQGPRSRQFHIFPGSGLFKSGPRWLMSAEIVETTKPYARCNAAIKPEWIEEQGRHLLKRRYFDPHWSKRAGRVMAWEQVSLYGLVVVEKRRIQYADKAPEEAREIFILHALVRGELNSRAPFLAQNKELRREVEKLEHKRRRHDVVADERAQFDFFEARVPSEVNSAQAFERWYSGLDSEARSMLEFGLDILMREDASDAPQDLYPDVLEIAGKQLELSYRFEPGHEEDGVTLTVPLEHLNTLNEAHLSWLVPGLRRDKVIALIRQLPRPLRRALTPPIQFADAALESISPAENQSLEQALATEFRRMTGMEIETDSFARAKLEPFLHMRIAVIDESGEQIDAGRNLSALQARLGRKARRRFMDLEGAEHQHDGARDWTFGDLPRTVTTRSGTEACPAVVDQENAVGVRLYDTFEEAWLAHQAGLLRLLKLKLQDKLAYLEKHHGMAHDALLAWAAEGSPERLIRDLVSSTLEDCAGDMRDVRSENSFELLLGRVRNQLGPKIASRAKTLGSTLQINAAVRKQLSKLRSSNIESAEDIDSQLGDMIYEGFLLDLEPGRLEHYPRYLEAISVRLEKMALDPAQDRRKMQRVAPWWKRYLDHLQGDVVYDEALDEYRWLVEEFRVSCFAQQLGTEGKVSEKRLATAWSEVNRNK